jgi:aryl-alcohol dehydrogenase-like predicted oxidoreductase
MNAASDPSLSRMQKGSEGAKAKLVLGTAQLGLDYGIVSERAPSSRESIEIIQTAIAGGVRYLDTASAYGSSEEIIGEALADYKSSGCHIVTKLSPLSEVSEAADVSTARSFAERSLIQSMRALRQPFLDTVLFHRVAHIQKWNSSIFNLLREWQSSGRIGSIGASVQSADELAFVLEVDEISHIQLPYNMFDHRWDASLEQIRAVKENRSLTINIRSIFLQGILMTGQHSLWQRAHVREPTATINWLNSLCLTFEKPDIASLCIAWARGLDWVNGIVIGCDNLGQLRRNLQRFEAEALSQERLDWIRSTRPVLSEQTLNPALWIN